MDIQELHKKCIYPAVRVKTGKAGGSGTAIYSKKDKEGNFCSLILTCHHVVSDAIEIKDEWDSVLKKKAKKEVMDKVTVEIFDYVNVSTINSTNSYRADILAYDVNHDLAVLRLNSPKEVPFVALLVPENMIEGIHIGTPVYAVGCSLLHDPVLSPGIVTYLQELLDNRKYLMSNADIIFGNSGGSLYLGSGELIGVPSRVTVLPMGFSAAVQTWMGFSCHPERLYEFFKEQELQFIYDEGDTFEASMKRRDKKMKEAKEDQRKEEEEK